MKKVLFTLFLTVFMFSMGFFEARGETPQYLRVTNIITPAAANGIYVKQSGTTGLNPDWDYWKHESENYYIYADIYSDSYYYWNIDNNLNDNDDMLFSNDESTSINFLTERTSPNLVTSWAQISGTHNPPTSLVQVEIYTPILSPTITSATFNAFTGSLVVTGTNLSANSNGSDIDATKFTILGQGGGTYTLTAATSNVEITSATEFTLTISGADKTAVDALLNKNGTESVDATIYNLAAAGNWCTNFVGGADATNGITVSNVPSAPTTQTSNILFSNVTSNGTAISWTRGNGSNCAVFMSPVTSGTASPSNNTTYTANTNYGSGTQIGSSGWYCVYNGTGTSTSVVGLNSSQAYRVHVCEYNGNAGSELYNTSGGTNNPLNIPAQASNITVSTNENTDKVLSTVDFGCMYGSLTAVKITTLPKRGTIYLDANSNQTVDEGEAVTRNQEITSTDISNEKLRFKPVINSAGANYTEFRFKVKTDEYSIKAYTMYINVIAASVSIRKIETENSIGTFASAWAFKVADMDNDGDNDIVATAGSVVRWFRNTDGTGAFTAVTADDITMSIFVRALDVADINNDGYFDIICGDWNGDVNWYQNNAGDINQASPNVIYDDIDSETSAGLYDIICADIDDDGDLDVLTANSMDEDKIYLYRNTNGLGSFGAGTAIATSIDAICVSVGDVDQNGTLDVIGTHQSGGEIYWYSNDGTGTFSSGNALSASLSSVRCAYTYDIDRDGDMDIITASSGDNRFAWFENNGSQSFSRNNVSTTAQSAYSLYSFDIDEDGDLDLVGCAPKNPDFQNILYFLNNGSQNFGDSIQICETADYNRLLGIGDIDGDGFLDIVGNGTNVGEISWFKNELGLSLPILTTAEITSISTSGASCGGNISDQGIDEVTARGVVWSTTTAPALTTNETNHTADGTGIGDFTSSIAGLTAGTQYYVRAYAENTDGIGYGNEVNFWTLCAAPTATDASFLSVSSFSANWEASTGATKYYLDVSTSNTFNTFVSGFENKDVSNVLTYSVTGLNPETTYYYRVRAYNSAGSGSNSNTITAVTLKAYFSDGTNYYATWSDAVSGTTEGGTITLLDNYTLSSDVTLTKNVNLNLAGYTFSGSGVSTISSAKYLTLNNSQEAGAFSGVISYAETTCTLKLFKPGVLGANFAVLASSTASGIIEIGDGTNSITYPLTIGDERFNSKVSKVIAKSGAVLNLSN